MSILRTYGREPDGPNSPVFRWPLYHLNDGDWSVDKEAKDFRPGDWTCHANGGGTGRGIVVAVTDDEIAVLWSISPQETDFTRFIFPPIKRATPAPLVAQQLVSIQPMTAPSGAIFYMDYKYGNDEPEKAAEAPEKTSPSPQRSGRPTRGPRKNP